MVRCVYEALNTVFNWDRSPSSPSMAIGWATYFAAPMGSRITRSDTPAGEQRPIHVLFLPKWWPGPTDPQLGDFLRKQALAVAMNTNVSVMHVFADKTPHADYSTHLYTEGDLWELRVHYPASTHPKSFVRKVVNAWRYRKASLFGWDRVIVERGMPDLVHVHILLRPGLFALWLKHRHGLPYVVSEQSSEYMNGAYRNRSWLTRSAYKHVFSQAAAVTAVSHWLGKALVDHGLCTHHTVVPNVVPGLERPLPEHGQAGQFLMVADLVDHIKNVSGVLRALALVRRQDSRIKLVIIGDGPDRARLERLVGELGLEGAVRFMGRLANSEVLEHMASTSSVIINSNVETFSVVTGEALGQGKPVIATRCGGPEAFVTGNNGILIDVGDTAALGTAMLHITAALSGYVPEDIRASVSARFSPAAVGRSFQKIYQELAAR